MLVNYYQLRKRESRKFGYIKPSDDDIFGKRYEEELQKGMVPELYIPECTEFGDMYGEYETGYIVSERLKKVLELFSNPEFVGYLPVNVISKTIGQEQIFYRVWFKYLPGVLSEYSKGYESPYDCLVPAFINKEVAKCGNVFTCGAVWRGGIYVTEEVYKALKDAKINKNIHYIHRGGIDEGDEFHWEGE